MRLKNILIYLSFYSATFQTDFLNNLKKFTKLDPEAEQRLIYCGNETFTQANTQVQAWDSFCLRD